MIDCKSAKYVYPFHATKVPYFQRKSKNLKNVKRVCPKRKIKGQKEEELAKRKIKEMNPNQKARKVC